MLTLLFLVNVNLTGCSKTDRYPKNRKGQKEFADEHPPESKKGPEPDSILFEPVPYNPDTVRDQELKILGFELPAVVVTGNEVQFSVTIRTSDNKKERVTLKGYTEQDTRYGTGLFRAILQDTSPNTEGKQRLKAIAVCLDGAVCQSMFVDVRYMINGVERRRQFSHIVEATTPPANPNEDDEIPDHGKYDPNDPNNSYTGHLGEFVGVEPFDRGEFLGDLMDRRIGGLNIPRYNETQVPIVTLPKEFIPELLPKTEEPGVNMPNVNPNTQPQQQAPPSQSQPQQQDPVYDYPQPTQPTPQEEPPRQEEPKRQEENLPVQPVPHKPRPGYRTPTPMEMPDSDIYPEGYKRPQPAPQQQRPVVKPQPKQEIPIQPTKPTPVAPQPQKPEAPLPSPKMTTPVNPPPPPPKIIPPEMRGELAGPRPQIQNPIAVLSGLPNLVLNLVTGGKADGYYGFIRETDVNNRPPRPGRLIDASEQAMEGIGFKRAPFPQSQLYRFGTGLVVDVLSESAQEFRRLKGYENNVMFINHISKREGGSNSGHGSHQNGLDVDIAYLNEVTATTFEDQTANVRASKFDYKRNFLYWAMMINTGYMHVVFVSAEIKRGFCVWAKQNNLLTSGAEVLRRLSIESGHHNHFHMRMKCSPHYPTCQNQRDLIPKGKTGCEAFGIQ